MNKIGFNTKTKRIIVISIAAATLFAAPSLSIAEDSVQAPPASKMSFMAEEIAQNSTATGVAIEPVTTAPAPVSVYKVKAKADGKSFVNVKWSKVAGAKGYTIYRSTSIDKRGKRIATIKGRKNNSFKDETAIIKETYYYTVKAWTKSAGERVTIATVKSNKVKNKLHIKKSLQCKTYAYSGHTMTASGMSAQVGRVAVDPRVIPLGTWLYVEGYGLCQAADTGGDIKGQTLDLFMNSNGECEQWGVRYKKVYILES